jgi:Patatin-like phospholipase
MTVADNRRHWPDAFAEELAEVEKRQIGPKPLRDNLVGIAFSGGGIRSATFGLGVLEGLKSFGLLRHIDYLSTVSGGGYIGAWLSANCKRAAERRAVNQKLPEWLDPAADWTPSIAHLRRYSNYLSPKVGFFSADTWSMFMIWIRNSLLVQVTVILAIAVTLLLPRPLFEGFQHWPEVGHWRWATVALFLLGVVGIAGNQLRLNTRGSIPLLQGKSWPISAVATLISLLVAWRIGAHFAFDPFTNGQIDYKPAVPIALLLVSGGFWFQPAAVKLLSIVWPGKKPPQQINYTQAWAQWTIVLPMMATGYLVAAILWGQSKAGGLAKVDSFGGFFQTAVWYWPFPLSVIFASLWLLSFCSIRSRRDWKGLLAALFAPVPALLVLHALLCAIMLLLHQWAQAPERPWLAFVCTPAMVLYAFSLTIVMLIGMMGRQSTDEVREWWSRLGAWLGIYGFAWMLISMVAVFGPRGAAALIDAHPWTALGAGGGWLGTTVAGLFAGHSGSTGGDSKGEKAPSAKILEVIAVVAPFVFIAGLLVAVSVGLEYIVFVNLSIEPQQTWPAIGVAYPNPPGFLLVSLLVGAACLAALILMAARVDINEFGLNAFYRNRLVRCYLGATRYLPGERKPQNFTGFDGNDDMRLADLRGESPSAGPFHIVNCASNLGGSSDLALHTRHSATFTLSPLQCGSSYESKDHSGAREELGYISTPNYGGRDGAPTLGQVISVSGAAVSPNMGYHTSPVVAFLLTLFNVRLGWWFPNPLRSAINLPSPFFNLSYLLTELFGGADDKAKFLMISDGGHFENLAAYELVRRRCRVIIISDAEADPRLTFAGLGTLIRMCEVDFGAQITLDVWPIRPAPGSAWSNSPCAVGRIDYGPGIPPGVLIYLKASMTGHEDTSVLQYKASHPDFPHESTANQFYGEDQFESYRHLGRETATRCFGAVSGARDIVALASSLQQMYPPTRDNVG